MDPEILSKDVFLLSQHLSYLNLITIILEIHPVLNFVESCEVPFFKLWLENYKGVNLESSFICFKITGYSTTSVNSRYKFSFYKDLFTRLTLYFRFNILASNFELNNDFFTNIFVFYVDHHLSKI